MGLYSARYYPGGIGSFITYYGQHLLSQPSNPVAGSPIPPVVFLPERPEIIEVHVGDINIQVTTVIVPISDGKEKMGTVAVSILAKEASWAFERSDQVLLNRNPIDMEQFFRSDGMQTRFAKAKDIIAVGAASEQGPVAKEEIRAQERADQLVHWLRKTIITPETGIFTLNIGRFKEAKGRDQEETAAQRRVVIISVLQKDIDLDLERALQISLEQNSAWPYRLEDYSTFRLRPAT